MRPACTLLLYLEGKVVEIPALLEEEMMFGLGAIVRLHVKHNQKEKTYTSEEENIYNHLTSKIRYWGIA